MSLSLWLVPHEGNPFTKAMKELIADDVPRNFLSPQDIQGFPPHVTVSNDVNLDGKSPQDFLDGLKLPEFKNGSNEVEVLLDTIQAEDPKFRKMNISVMDDANLKKLAAACRSQAVGASGDEAKQWAENNYRPHMSLLYADTPTKDVKNKVPLIESKVQFAIGDIFACCGGTLCMGGSLTLVDTSQDVGSWKTVAQRETPWVMWRATRNLI